jgi:hypothetical protein
MKKRTEERIQGTAAKISLYKFNIKFHTNFEVHRFIVGITNVHKIPKQFKIPADILPRSVYTLYTVCDNQNEHNSRNCVPLTSLVCM